MATTRHNAAREIKHGYNNYNSDKMKKNNKVTMVASLVLAIVGLVMIIFNIIESGSWMLTVGLACIVLGQLLLLPNLLKRNKD